MTTIIVMAKEPVPGRVKTRLHPPFTLEEAAEIAQAALADTVDAVREIGDHRVLCLHGSLPEVPGFGQIPQSEGGLDARIAQALDDIDDRVLLIGMDTPHLDPDLLARLAVWPEEVDAWFGPATDGGFWLLGLRRVRELRDRAGFEGARGDLVRGVPMSDPVTGAETRKRLVAAGLRVRDVPVLTDVDDVSSLTEVLRSARDGRLARTVERIERTADPERDLPAAIEAERLARAAQ